MAETAQVEYQEHLILGEDCDALRYVGSLTIDQILETPSDGDGGLSFDTAHVFAVDSSKSSSPTMELQFGGEPLRGKQFLNLLQAIAPVPIAWGRDYENADAIFNDWVVYESVDDHMQELAARHSGLKGWTQLGREYPDLKAALEPATSGRPLPWMLDGNENIISPEKFISHWGDAESLASGDPLVETPKLFQLLIDVYGEEEAKIRVIHAMKSAAKAHSARPDGVALEGLNDDELFDRFNAIGIEERNQLVSVSSLQSNLGQNSWSRSALTKKFTDLYLERHCVTFKTEDGQIMYAHGIRPDEDINQAYAKRRKVYVGSDRRRGWAHDHGAAFEYELMDVDTLIGKETAIIPGTIQFQETGLVPTVRWTKDASGKRGYRNLPEHPGFTSYKQDVRSGVAGLMVLAYLKPENRARWHTERRLPSFERAQEMGPAQVPLIALQHARRLLDNELIEQAEELISVDRAA